MSNTLTSQLGTTDRLSAAAASSTFLKLASRLQILVNFVTRNLANTQNYNEGILRASKSLAFRILL